MSFIVTILSVVIYFAGVVGLLLWLFFYARRKEQRDKDFIEYIKGKLDNDTKE